MALTPEELEAQKRKGGFKKSRKVSQTGKTAGGAKSTVGKVAEGVKSTAGKATKGVKGFYGKGKGAFQEGLEKRRLNKALGKVPPAYESPSVRKVLGKTVLPAGIATTAFEREQQLTPEQRAERGGRGPSAGLSLTEAVAGGAEDITNIATWPVRYAVGKMRGTETVPPSRPLSEGVRKLRSGAEAGGAALANITGGRTILEAGETAADVYEQAKTRADAQTQGLPTPIDLVTGEGVEAAPTAVRDAQAPYVAPSPEAPQVVDVEGPQLGREGGAPYEFDKAISTGPGTYGRMYGDRPSPEEVQDVFGGEDSLLAANNAARIRAAQRAMEPQADPAAEAIKDLRSEISSIDLGLDQSLTSLMRNKQAYVTKSGMLSQMLNAQKARAKEAGLTQRARATSQTARERLKLDIDKERYQRGKDFRADQVEGYREAKEEARNVVAAKYPNYKTDANEYKSYIYDLAFAVDQTTGGNFDYDSAEGIQARTMAMSDVVDKTRDEGGVYDAVANWLHGHISVNESDKLSLDFANWKFDKGRIGIPLVGNDVLQKIVGPDAAGDYVYLKNLDERTVALIQRLQAADKKKRTARSVGAGNR